MQLSLPRIYIAASRLSPNARSLAPRRHGNDVSCPACHRLSSSTPSFTSCVRFHEDFSKLSMRLLQGLDMGVRPCLECAAHSSWVRMRSGTYGLSRLALPPGTVVWCGRKLALLHARRACTICATRFIFCPSSCRLQQGGPPAAQHEQSGAPGSGRVGPWHPSREMKISLP